MIGGAGRPGPAPVEPATTYPVLLALGGLDAAGYSVIAPVVPAIAAATGAGPGVMGMLVASFPVGTLVGFLLAGQGVRRQRLRGVLLAALVLVALGCLGFVLGQGLAVWFAARLLMGAGSGGLWIAVTFTTLERWPGQEYQCMSRIFAAYSAGGLVGPVLGATGGIRGPFLAYLALVLAALPLVALLGRPARPRWFRADRGALRLRGFWLACAGIMVATLALGLSEGVLPLHFASRLGQAQLGALYAGAAVVVAATSVLAGGMVPRRALAGGVVLLVAGIGLAGAAEGVALFVVALGLAGAGIGLGQTGATGILLGAVAPERIVTAMVLWSQLGIAGYLVGPLVGGAVAQALGFQAVGLVPLAGAVLLLGIARRAARPAGW